MADLHDLYRTLGVRKGATALEIRKAFRKKAKKLHPDTAGKRSAHNIEAFHALVYAYNTLMDARTRDMFAALHNRPSDEGEKAFDYHNWLLARADDESMAKLVFWDLTHGRENDAADEYCGLVNERASFSMRHWFTREDFMDLGYILAEELDQRKHYYEALCLLAEIIKMERERAYFHFFFPEVVSFALRILKRNIEAGGNDELSLDAYERALELQLGEEEDVYFLTRMASIYSKMGDGHTAALCSEAAFRLGQFTGNDFDADIRC